MVTNFSLLLIFYPNCTGEDPESVAMVGRVHSYLFADTQVPNEDDEDRDFQIVDRVLLGGELCDPYAGDDQTTYE